MDAILQILTDACMAGALEVLAVRQSGSVGAKYKDATELVTEADQRSDAAICRIFAQRLPPTVSYTLEESGSSGPRGAQWVGADPLDGTNHFACGGNFYSIQAHYVEDGVPQAGVVFQPEIYLPLSGQSHCTGRISYAVRGSGAFFQVTEYTGSAFHLGDRRILRRIDSPPTRTFVSCVPLSTKMTPGEKARALRVIESGLISVTTGLGGAGANVMMTIFGGQQVYANFGAGEDLDLIPPQVIAEEAGMTVWGLDRQAPRWYAKKQPFVVAPTSAIAAAFLDAAGC
ncbi:MAG: inositol monophosphatase family protein [Bryobacteraceae bacterium]